ncbi:megakaryocyte-associated tyrosine-protein kinase isoform X1 [Conger conger]|uniref:megakaryocyte-associated tyrosine-protein kinase isoform X1 n=1 Tax=Conger conger TaxID=82655 RepID=UPI002A59C040|nr:megakaryocyte-associated tyrosine-protein kinase isoform X1 [Conger conger]XP_061093746.1 megakaryocyte-associated tyrosine-protein kinase isoform X1 [Conger conger]XP_061093747.1 megakaryocyte-associated tyrosine-protein kinase isoform X1 [Conger conger]
MATKCWAPGTQCIAKNDHSKPKADELAYRKGDILTIVEIGMDKGVYKATHNKTGVQGLISACNVREREAIRIDPSLSLMPWFHGKISGPEAVNQLRPMEDGLFLVRESIRHPGDYVLCVSFAQEVIHYRVIYRNNKLTIDNKQFFYNLIDMIEFYTKNQGAIATTLQKPKQKVGAKSAEAELAKAGWLLDMQKLTLGESIGEGEFGAVYEGVYMGQTVAVKNIKCDVTAQAFLEETTVMTKLQHPNLVRLLGVILDNGLCIVTELMAKGNLVNFLRTKGRSVIGPTQLLRFALARHPSAEKRTTFCVCWGPQRRLCRDGVPGVQEAGAQGPGRPERAAVQRLRGEDQRLRAGQTGHPDGRQRQAAHQVDGPRGAEEREILHPLRRLELRGPLMGDVLLRQTALPKDDPEGGEGDGGAGLSHGGPGGLPPRGLRPHDRLLGVRAQEEAVFPKTAGQAEEGAARR